MTDQASSSLGRNVAPSVVSRYPAMQAAESQRNQNVDHGREVVRLPRLAAEELPLDAGPVGREVE